MDKKELHYASLDEQISKLKSHYLIIQNEERAKKVLEAIGYSNLIKSYREPYIISTETGKMYRSDVTFEQIYSLYLSSKNLRNAVMASMLDLEERIKESAADVIARSFGIHQDDYLAFRNYQNKRKRKQRFSLSGILTTMKDTLDTDKNPIHHYTVQYGFVPPWILFKSVYLSTIINFIDLMKKPQQTLMVKKLYPDNASHSPEVMINLMMDTLFTCLEYRNIAAHGGRIYNYRSNRRVRFSSEIPFSMEGFSQLLQILNFMKYTAPYEHLQNVLTHELNRHCSNYPQDVTYLGQILNVNIFKREIVWVTDKTNKYHINQHCSGMQNAKQIDLTEAIKQGFIQCKRCCQTY
ncbi:MAG: Abi family protein [Lachnospiraceae bacterium]|nr:Abi family protein [Lachnospiraceae bacterium]